MTYLRSQGLCTGGAQADGTNFLLGRSPVVDSTLASSGQIVDPLLEVWIAAGRRRP